MLLAAFVCSICKYLCNCACTIKYEVERAGCRESKRDFHWTLHSRGYIVIDTTAAVSRCARVRTATLYRSIICDGTARPQRHSINNTMSSRIEVYKHGYCQALAGSQTRRLGDAPCTQERHVEQSARLVRTRCRQLAPAFPARVESRRVMKSNACNTEATEPYEAGSFA